ncbi:hypothetical protein [uncultured Lacinutrix sp.]|uniref:hypothetical protein n=1 Tax=uncultured Lacinutrix sp. TaxID=574032 RepID=UPI00262317FD|nr:hypothetical protein [uncultured Lacinutrix sp.]
METSRCECIGGVCAPRRKQGLKVKPKKGKHELVKLKGPGLFLAAHLSKQGGTNDISFVDLTIDGESIFNLSYAAMKNLGFRRQNPYGMVLVKTGLIENVTLGFPYPLKFEKELVLTFTAGEPDIAQVIGNVIYGKC